MINQFSKNLYYIVTKKSFTVLIFKDVFRSISVSFSKIKPFTDFQVAHNTDIKILWQTIFLRQITDSFIWQQTILYGMLPYSETAPIHPHASMLQQAGTGYHSSRDLKTKGCLFHCSWTTLAGREHTRKHALF